MYGVDLIYYIATVQHIQLFTSGLLDTRPLVYYASSSPCFSTRPHPSRDRVPLPLASLDFPASWQTKLHLSNPSPPRAPIRRLQIGLNVFFQVVLTLALFLVINYLSYTHYERRDLTPGKDYSLSDSTLNYVHKINKDVKIILISSGNSDTMKNVRMLAEDYRRAKSTRIHIEDIDPVRDIEQAEQIKLATGIALRGNGVLVAANEHGRFIPEETLVIRGMTGGRENPSVDFRGEDAITSAIQGLLEGGTRKIYAVVGKGAEDNRAKSLNALAALGQQQNIATGLLDLDDTKTIPADADGLVIVGPHYDFTEPEMALIQAYWETKRSSLLILMDPNSETPRLWNFLSGNGVTPRMDRVLNAESTPTGPKKDFAVQTIFLDGVAHHQTLHQRRGTFQWANAVAGSAGQFTGTARPAHRGHAIDRCDRPLLG